MVQILEDPFKVSLHQRSGRKIGLKLNKTFILAGIGVRTKTKSSAIVCNLCTNSVRNKLFTNWCFNCEMAHCLQLDPLQRYFPEKAENYYLCKKEIVSNFFYNVWLSNSKHSNAYSCQESEPKKLMRFTGRVIKFGTLHPNLVSHAWTPDTSSWGHVSEKIKREEKSSSPRRIRALNL